MSNKNVKILKEVVCKYHPIFKKSRTLKKLVSESPEIFNVERLVEETLAIVNGKIKRIDGYGFDFSDGSECKTATMRQENARGKFILKNGEEKTYFYKKSYTTITNVEGKTGSLRVVMYNTVNDNLDYYYIPIEYYKSRKLHPTKYSKSQLRLSPCILKQFECSSFEELAKRKYVKKKSS